MIDDPKHILYNKTFEDLVSDDIKVRLCIGIDRERGGNPMLPSGDNVTALVLSLQNEEGARKSINVLDAFLKLDEVPDFPEVAYDETWINRIVDINHENAAKFLAGSRAHPFSIE